MGKGTWHKTPTQKEMMGQGTSPKIPSPDMSVEGLMKQGKAKTHSGQGTRTVKDLMKQ
jgi:hypothetical protein